MKLPCISGISIVVYIYIFVIYIYVLPTHFFKAYRSTAGAVTERLLPKAQTCESAAPLRAVERPGVWWGALEIAPGAVNFCRISIGFLLNRPWLSWCYTDGSVQGITTGDEGHVTAWKGLKFGWKLLDGPPLEVQVEHIAALPVTICHTPVHCPAGGARLFTMLRLIDIWWG